MHIHPYLPFEGRCEEAVNFYRDALNAEVVMMMRFKDAPEPCMSAPGNAEKIMHADLRIGDSTIFASDGRCSGENVVNGTTLSLGVRDDAEAARVFAALAPGGQVAMPLGKTFFSSSFGIVIDRFGVQWMIIVPQ